MNSKQQKRTTSKAFRLFLAAALLAVVLGAHHVPVACAGTTITVDETTDELNSDGDCSLREAIQAANTDNAVDACPAGSGADTITLPGSTYTLSLSGAGEDANATGDLDITDDLTINGAGVDITTINGGGIDRVLHVHSGATVELNDLTITNGKTPDGGACSDGEDGGGIYNSGTLTLTAVTVSSNSAGNGGNATGTESWGGSGGDGGGIYSGSLTLNTSTVSGNSAGAGGTGTSAAGGGGYGGGIYKEGGSLTADNSTLSGNAAPGEGGAIYNLNGDITLDNVTVANNTADSDSDGSGDGGGIYKANSAGTVAFRNTILADNTDNGGQAPECGGWSLTSQDYNLIENTTGCTIGGTTTHNVTGQDPQLDLLADNGGDTQTHALQPGSPAIDAGSCTDTDSNPVTADQRGVSRPQGSTCDIGAYEYVPGTGPGGVGDTNGTSTLELWLKADDGTGQTSDGSAVSTWEDKSGYDHDVSQGTADYRPTFQNGAGDTLNGQPVVRFDATDYLAKSILGSDLFSTDQATIFFAKKSTGGVVWFKWESSSSNRVGFELYSNATRFDFPNGTLGSGQLRGTTSIVNAFHIIAGHKSATTQSIYLDGAQDATQSNSLTLSTDTTQALVIGKNTGGSLSWTGDIAEVIVYRSALNSAQRLLVENYLSAKYGIAISNDKYTGNDSAYVYDVAGIGQESDGSHSEGHSGGLVLSASSGFLQDNGDYLMAGHNGATGTTGNDCPSGMSSRWQRVWYFAKTDVSSNGGNVDIRFDFSEAGFGTTPSGTYQLLKRDGTSGNFSSIASSTSISGDQVIFSNVDSTNLGSYFTLGEGTPTAVTLTTFAARAAGRVNGFVLPLALIAVGVVGGTLVLRARRRR